MADVYQCQVKIAGGKKIDFGVGDINNKANRIAVRKIKELILAEDYELWQIKSVKINGYNVTAKIMGAVKAHGLGE